MTRKTDAPWTDHDLPRILDLKDGDGPSAAAIGRIMGTTKDAILCVLHRIRHADTPDACVLPQNCDGGMGRGWWREGLRKRK